MLEDPEWINLTRQMHDLDSILGKFRRNFQFGAIPEVQADAIFSCVKSGNLNGIKELAEISYVHTAIQENNLEVENFIQFAKRYQEIYARSQIVSHSYWVYSIMTGNLFYKYHRWKKEIRSYDLDDCKSILDIGSGYSDLYKVLLRDQNDLEIFLNDIDHSALREIKYHLRSNRRIIKWTNKNRNQVSIVQGTPRCTGVEHLIFDRIILRQSFHHFEDFGSMLQSIKKSMNASTLLVVIEIFKEEEETCPQAINQNTFLQSMSEQGLRLQAEFPFRKDDGIGHVFHYVLDHSEETAILKLN